MHPQQEYILSAAIWYKDYPELPISYMVKGTDKGIVLCGCRHSNIIGQCFGLLGKAQREMGAYEQGFITNLNRFVNRSDAAQIALKAKQINKLSFSNYELFSEDLY